LKTGPPFASIFFRARSAKKPMNRPSGDQNGRCAPSVPASSRGEGSSRCRTQSRLGLSPRRALKTRREPSGEISMGPASIQVDTSSAPSGGRIDARSTETAGASRVRRRAESAAVASAKTAATSQLNRPPRAGRVGTEATVPAADREPSAIQRSSFPTSPALCQRSSGSFARQVATTRSSAAGDIGWTCEIGAGSSFMIAEISDAWLVPEKAFLPVTIS